MQSATSRNPKAPLRDRPHFVRDYRRFVSKLLSNAPDRDAAMATAVGGGDFHIVGARERDLLVALGLKRGDYVIDVGCGSGRLALPLGEVPGIRYLGTDVVPELLAYAECRCAKQGSRFEVVDGLTIPEADGIADFVAFFSVLTHLRTQEGLAYLQEAKRVLKPDGKIVVSYLDSHALPLAYLARFFCSQMLYIVLGRGVKSVLSSEKAMQWMAMRLGLHVRFLGPVVGQSVCVLTRC
jgi:ubiquinone/menaquinone biosynthesis C-methylase UbiE